MSKKQRALPSWMVKTEKNKEKQPLLSKRKQKVARSVFYCMNEKELVEAAVSYLTSGVCKDVALLSNHKVGDKAEEGGEVVFSKAKSEMEDLEMDSSDCSTAQEEAGYVSETDLDVTEAETLPYSRTDQHRGQKSRPALKHSDTEQDPEKRQESLQTRAKEAEKEGDDDMRLVREIFFT